MKTALTGPQLLALVTVWLFSSLPLCNAAEPTGTHKTFNTFPTTTSTLTQADWGFFDFDTPPDAFTAVKITTLPTLGTLQVDGVNAIAGQIVSIASGSLPGATWTPQSAAGNRTWFSIASSADGNKLAAVDDGGLIYTSTNAGVTWTPRASSESWWAITFSADGTKLAAVANGGQIHTSTDSGASWTPRETNRGWVSITSSTDGSKLAAVVDGGQIYTSANSGGSWTARDSSRAWSSITSSADGSKLAAVEAGGRIYTSTDSGVTWTPRASNRNWRCITSSADGTKLAAGEYQGQIYTSTDSGATWTAQAVMGSWLSITSSADGTKLAAVEYVGLIYTSTDSGSTWAARESNRSWYSVASSADGNKLAAVVYGGGIYTSLGSSTAEATITYTAPAGAGSDHFYFQVQDSGATNNLDPSPNTLSFNFAPPTPPSGMDKAFTVHHTTNTVLRPADWGFSDSEYPPQNFRAVKITTLPASGTLQIDGVDATAGQTAYILPGSGPAGAVWVEKLNAGYRDWNAITSSADGSKLAAVVENGKIYTSIDSGETWTSRESNRNWVAITSSSNGSKLAAVVENGQIYTSTDSGQTWTPRESNRRWRSITSSSSGTKLAAVENYGYIYTSTDSGATWTARTTWGSWQAITSSADGTKLAAVANYGQIFTSIDSGATWIPRGQAGPWQSITSSADGTKLAAVERFGQIYTSTDSGVTWTARGQGNGEPWGDITSSSDGTRLAAVQEGGRIYTSTDSGVTWMVRDEWGSWISITSNLDGTKLAAVKNGGRIYTSIGVEQIISYTAPIGTGSASFTYQVQDSAPIDNLDLSPNTLSFNYSPSLTPAVQMGPYFGFEYGPFSDLLIYTLNVPVQNTTANSINGFRLSVDLSAYATSHPTLTLDNPSSPSGTTPAYVDYPFPVAVGQTISLPLSFSMNANTSPWFPFPFDPVLSVTTLSSSAVGGPIPSGLTFTSATIQQNFVLPFSSQPVSLVWPSTPGRFYRIYYSNDLITWFPSPSPILAFFGQTEWSDTGPPYTGALPGAARFYKVSEIPAPP